MKTRYKIIIIPVVVVLAVFSFLFLRSADDSLLICEDRLLNSDQCHKFLNDKYKTMMPAVSRFLDISKIGEFGMHIENFQVKKLIASSLEGKLVAHMEIDTATSTVFYRCVALEDSDNMFVNIENPTVEDIDNNHCSSFDTEHLKSQDELKCEQIGGNFNHPEFEGCVVESFVCEHGFDNIDNFKECKTGLDMCKELGGKPIECMPCRDSVRAQFEELGEPAPCDFRCPSGCEFP